MTFILYDPNMNKLEYPVGVMPLDISVSSIEKERVTENIEGIPGTIDYGFNYKNREITLKFATEHFHDTFDFRLQRDEFFSLLDSQPYFYLCDIKLPTRVIKVTFDSVFTPERYGYWYSTFDVSPTNVGIPFWQSRFTTQHIQQYKYNADNELFGLGDNIHLDYLDYSFKTYEFDVWNGGNVDLDPRDMYIKYTLNNVSSNGNLTIENVTTGEKFVFKESLVNQTLYINQTKVNVGVVNRLRDSNRQFPTIKKGLNHFKITNCSYSSIDIDFRYLWK